MKNRYNHISDEELDQLFRDAAEQFRPPHAAEGAWENFLNDYWAAWKPTDTDNPEQINQPTPHKKRGVLSSLEWPLKIAACLLIALGALWLISKKDNKRDGDIETLVQTDKKADNITDHAKIHAKPDTKETIRPGTGDAAPNTAEALYSIQKQEKVAPGNENILGLIPNSENKLIPKPGNNVVQNKPADNNAAVKNKYSRSLIATSKPDNNNRLKDNSTSPYQKQTAVYSNTNSKWQIGILAGPNLSMVGNNISHQPGFNAGVVVQKKLGNSRFSLESGVIYESMVYSVANKDFNPNNKPVSPKVSNIEGTCSMIDVPINVRYDVVASKKGKAFISTGVSPTLIVAQSYIYDFERGNETVRIDRDVSGKGKSVYAVANISIGYEQKWDRTSVQIAPYLKIPTGEIGYGNLNLGGVGTQVSIKRDL